MVGSRQWLAALIDGATFTLIAQSAPGPAVDLVEMQGLSAKEIELYATHYLPDDLWRNAGIGRKVDNRAMRSTDIVSDLEWRHSRIYTDLLKPNSDVFHAIVARGTLPGNGEYALGIHRPSTSSPFKAEAAERIGRLLPHLRRALLVHSRLGLAGVQEQASAAVLDKLAFGIVQLGPRGAFISANAAAQRILQRNDGLALTRLGLRAASANDDNHLQLAIARAAGVTAAMAEGAEGGGHLRVRRPSGARPYTVIVAPLGLKRILLSVRQPVTMLIITDPDSGAQLDVKAMRALFGFTPAEARLVGLLVAGRSLPDIAKQLGIGFETARTHLARARAKTETASQVDLVKTVLLALAPVRTKQP